jgi:hypothetical protein
MQSDSSSLDTLKDSLLSAVDGDYNVNLIFFFLLIFQAKKQKFSLGY